MSDKVNIKTLNGHPLADEVARKAASENAERVEQLSEEIAENDLPLVFYGGALPQDKDVEVSMPFNLCSKSGNMKLYCKTKAQGTSSMSYPKKNQTTKFYADAACTEKAKVNFRNWGKQNKFCMKANWIDITHARNIVSARIWGDVVRSRANYAKLPELLRTSPNVGAIDGFPVLAYADSKYHGRYTINIPKDGWMANMDEDNPNHCILCGENYVSGCFRAPALINESDWSDELHETVPDNIKTRWNEVISFVMNSTDDEFKTNLEAYFDVLSLIDYEIFAIASCGLDSMGKNQLYLTYDGQKWIASMYDMDSTWGLYWDGRKLLAPTYGRKSFEDYVAGREGNLLYHRLEQLFHEQIKARWAELKSGALSYANILSRFEEYISITPPHVIADDYAATTVDGAFAGIPSLDTNNLQQIRAFAKGRLVYTDSYIEALPDAYVSSADALYPLKNGVHPNGIYHTLTITNGNHVKIETITNNIFADLTNGLIRGGADVFTYTGELFQLKTGDEIRREVKNIVATGVTDSAAMTVNLYGETGELRMGGDIYGLATVGNATYEGAVQADTSIGSVIVWANSNNGDNAWSLEFDVEIYVNGERYV